MEITLLDQPFQRAWRVGLEELAELPERERWRRTVNTDRAWEDFPPASPKFEGVVEAPERALFEASFLAAYEQIEALIEEHIDAEYLERLEDEPANDALRSKLIRLYLTLRQFDLAISTATEYLLEELGDKAATHNHLGMAYLMSDDPGQAALNFKRAMELRPEHERLQENLELALQKMGKATPKSCQQTPEAGAAGAAKGAVDELEVDDFYWME